MHTVDSPVASADRSGNASGSDRSSRRRRKQSSSPRGAATAAGGVSNARHQTSTRSHSQPSVELGVDDLSAIPGSFEADYSRSFHGGDSHTNDDDGVEAVAAMVQSLAAASRPVVATCPLTRKPMVRPALLVVDGFTYERSAIEAWLELKHASPATGQAASVADLHSPRRVVEEAKRDHALDARAQVTITD